VLDTTQTSSASDIYNRILDAMNKGDWETFGKEFSELGRVLG
jgi:outer membrane protein assembly factor BamD (BamD/ComL family)